MTRSRVPKVTGGAPESSSGPRWSNRLSGSGPSYVLLHVAALRVTRVALLAGALALGSVMIGITSPPAGAASAATLVSTSTTECGAVSGCSGTTLTAGDALAVTFNETPAVASSFSLTLTDGTNLGMFNQTNAAAGILGSTVTFTLAAGAPNLSVTKPLEVLSETGITAQGDGSTWNLVVSGEADKVVPPSLPATCNAIANRTRVFGGTNCSIGFGAAGPTAPQVYDIIAVPAWDLPGPPQDSAPEVITNCGATTTDTVYDLGSGATLGSAPCGTNLPGEGTPGLGNTTDVSLDYIATPSLTSFEQIGVVETIPGSTHYVSATAVPPQLTGINVSGQNATFHYNTPVVCETTPPTALTLAQFTYTAPWWSTVTNNGLVYPGDHGGSIACPSSTGATSITVDFGVTIPSGVRFRFDGNGTPNSIIGAPAPNSSFADESETSETAYVGPATTPPDPSISAFTAPTSPITSAGGSTTVSFTISDATLCTLSSKPSTGVGLSVPYRTSIVNPTPSPEAPCPDSTGAATVTLPANTSTSPRSYVITLTASSVPGTTAASQTLTLVVPVQPPVTAPSNSTGPTGSMEEFTPDHANGLVWNAYNDTANAGGPTITGTPSPVVAGLALHAYARGANGDLIEYVNDNAGGRTWNAYDLSAAAGGGYAIASDPSAVFDTDQGLVHVYAVAANGHLTEYLADHQNGHVWNAYDLTGVSGGGTNVYATPNTVFNPAIDLVRIYAEGAGGHLYEYLSDHQNGHVWNAYDLSAVAGGGTAVTGQPSTLYNAASGLFHIYVAGRTARSTSTTPTTKTGTSGTPTTSRRRRGAGPAPSAPPVPSSRWPRAWSTCT